MQINRHIRKIISSDIADLQRIEFLEMKNTKIEIKNLIFKYLVLKFEYLDLIADCIKQEKKILQ